MQKNCWHNPSYELTKLVYRCWLRTFVNAAFKKVSVSFEGEKIFEVKESVVYPFDFSVARHTGGYRHGSQVQVVSDRVLQLMIGRPLLEAGIEEEAQVLGYFS